MKKLYAQVKLHLCSEFSVFFLENSYHGVYLFWDTDNCSLINLITVFEQLFLVERQMLVS